MLLSNVRIPSILLSYCKLLENFKFYNLLKKFIENIYLRKSYIYLEISNQNTFTLLGPINLCPKLGLFANQFKFRTIFVSDEVYTTTSEVSSV